MMGKGEMGDVARMVRPGLAAALCAALAACASAASPRQLPAGGHGPLLTVGVDARGMTSTSANLVVHLTAQQPLPYVDVRVQPGDAALVVHPTGCTFRPLRPPIAPHATHAPYPLPAIPLCSLVVSATHAGRYPVILRVRDAAGRDLVAPIHTVIVIKGSRA